MELHHDRSQASAEEGEPKDTSGAARLEPRVDSSPVKPCAVQELRRLLKEGLVGLGDDPMLSLVAYRTSCAIAATIDRTVGRQSENEGRHLVDVELDKKRVELDWNVRIASANGSQRSVMRKSCLAEEGGELIGIGLSHEGVPSRGLTDRA